jgi:hypothetical protein
MATKKIVRSMNDLVLGIGTFILSIYLLTSKNIISSDIATGAGGRFAQAGTYVDLLAYILIILSVVLIVKAFNWAKREDTTGFIFLLNKEIVISVLAMVAYTWLLPRLGFTLTTLPFLFGLVILFSAKEITKGERKLTKAELKKVLLLATIFSVGMLLIVFLVFSVILKVTMP